MQHVFDAPRRRNISHDCSGAVLANAVCHPAPAWSCLRDRTIRPKYMHDTQLGTLILRPGLANKSEAYKDAFGSLPVMILAHPDTGSSPRLEPDRPSHTANEKVGAGRCSSRS